MSDHTPVLDAAGLRAVVAHNITAPAGWPGWIALSERMVSGDEAEYAPQTDVEATWRGYTTQTYESSVLPLVATREALQNSIDAVRLFGRFRRWGKFRTHEDALNALIADKGLNERFWAAMAAGTVAPLGANETRGRFDVTWDADTRTLAWSDDGIGMDAATLRKAFFTIPGTRKGAQGGGSGQTAGGFGIAKAVILGCGTGGFTIHTRDVRATGWHVSAEMGRVYRVGTSVPRVGTVITIKDVVWSFKKDYETKAVVGVPVNGPYNLSRGDGRHGASLLSMLREVMSVSDLPGLTMTLNGQEITTAFPGRGKSHPELGGVWKKDSADRAQVTAAVKSYKRDDAAGSVYVRLNGLYQFRTPGYGDLQRDYVVDLDVALTPDDPEYPLLSSRESFKWPTSRAYDSMVEHIKSQNRDPSPEQKEYDTYLPARTDREEAAGGREIEATVEATLAAPEVRAAMNAAMGAAAETLAAMFKERDAEAREIASHQAQGGGEPESRAGQYDYTPDDPTARDAVTEQDVGALPPNAPRATYDFTVPETYDAPPESPEYELTYDRQQRERTEVLDAVGIIARVIEHFQTHMKAHDGDAPYEVRYGLREAQYPLDRIREYPTDRYYRGEYELNRLLAGLRACVTLAYRPKGNGVFDVMRIRPALTALAYLAKLSDVGTTFALELARVSPFGGLGALKIKRYTGSEYPEAVKARRRAYVYRFRKGYAKWVPYLLAWDATLRILAKEGQLVRKKGSERTLLAYLPDFYPGFILDPTVHGMAAVEATTDDSTANVIYINPDDFASVVKAQRTRPMAIAGFLHNLACHELTHLNGNMAKGHERDFVIEREFLANSTCHLLPVIEAIVVHVLQLPPSAATVKAARRIEKLEAKVEALRAEKRVVARKPVAPALDIATLAHAFAQQVRSALGKHQGVDVAALVRSALDAFLAQPGIPAVLRNHEREILTKTIALLRAG